MTRERPSTTCDRGTNVCRTSRRPRPPDPSQSRARHASHDTLAVDSRGLPYPLFASIVTRFVT
jgi:hypothetical protein